MHRAIDRAAPACLFAAAMRPQRPALPRVRLAMMARLVEVIDWCHAVAVLHQIVNERTGWSQGQRDRWVRRAKSWLK